MILEITQIGNPVLRERSKEVSLDDLASVETQQFIDDLIDTKRAANGAGIAAPQVGVAKRIFVVEVANNPRYPYKPDVPLSVVVNPTVTFLTDDRYGNFEGCLSVPNLRGIVDRCPEIRVEGYDRHGSRLDFQVNGITAGTYQHENDHLDGVLFLDRVTDIDSFSTWEEFDKRHLEDVKKSVQRIVEQYGS